MKIFYNILYIFMMTSGIEALRLNYTIKTPLTNSEIFSSNKMGFPIPDNTDLSSCKKTPLQFEYPSSFSGIRVNSEMKIRNQNQQMLIEIDNRFMKNIVVFEKISPDLLHIEFDSHLYVTIPKGIHLFIIKKKFKELIQNIQTL